MVKKELFARRMFARKMIRSSSSKDDNKSNKKSNKNNKKQIVGIAGCGVMGCGIAQVFAQGGFPVVLYGRRWESLQGCIAKVKKHAPACISNIHVTIAKGDLAHCHLIIEAIDENLKAKQRLFAKLEAHCKPETIFATNTSSLSVSAIARACKRPQRVIGLHFFNPAPLMSVVEVVTTKRTEKETIRQAVHLVAACNKKPIIVEDKPGFVVNRLLLLMINQAVRTLEDGVAKKEDIDELLVLGAHHPMGPLKLADFIGLDVCVNILNNIHAATQNAAYKPAHLLVKLVKQGKLGKKSGKGFYYYIDKN